MPKTSSRNETRFRSKPVVITVVLILTFASTLFATGILPFTSMERPIFGLVSSLFYESKPASSSTLVISQAYGGGGGSTGTYLYDYVEIKNISDSTQSLNGLSIAYGSSTSNFNLAQVFPLPAVQLGAGQYFLIQTSNAGTAGIPLPAVPDAVTVNPLMSLSSGKVGLVTSGFVAGTCGATATPCELPNANIIDLISYGTSNNAEGGAPTNGGAALTAVQGNVRKDGGCMDTDNNNSDFDLVTGPVPRNMSSASSTCSGNPTPTPTPTPLPGTCAAAPAGLVAWWRAEGNADDLVGNNNGTLLNGAAFGNGVVGKGFKLNGSTQYVVVPHSDSINPTGALTLEAWVNVNVPQTGAPILLKDNPESGPYSLAIDADRSVRFQLRLGPWQGVSSPPNSFTPGTPFHAAGTYDSATGQYCVYVNGVPTCAGITGQLPLLTDTLKIGGDVYNQIYFNGVIDEPSIYNRALSPSEIQGIYNAGSAGKCPAVGCSVVAHGSAFADTTLIPAYPGTLSQDQIPVILIHGIHGNQWPEAERSGHCFDCAWDPYPHYFRGLIEYLNSSTVYNSKYKTYKFHYVSDRHTAQEIGQALRDHIDEMCEFGAKKIIIIAHSMGGIVSRHYMLQTTQRGQYSNLPAGERVDRLITLATPHHGTYGADQVSRGDRFSWGMRSTANGLLIDLDRRYWRANGCESCIPNPQAVNRRSLLWDDYDGLLNLYPNEIPTDIPTSDLYPTAATFYNDKITAYSGVISRDDSTWRDVGRTVSDPLSGPANLLDSYGEHSGSDDKKLAVAAYFIDSVYLRKFNILNVPNPGNDGLVPIESARFDGISLAGRVHCFGYNHRQMKDGYVTKCSDGKMLFKSIKDSLTGTPASSPPQLVAPESVGFGVRSYDLPRGAQTSSSATVDVEFSNLGDDTLRITSLSLGGSNPEQFYIENPPQMPIAVSATSSVHLSVAFNPTSPGPKSADLRAASDSSNDDLLVHINATGLPTACMLGFPPSSQFIPSNGGDGAVMIGDISCPWTVTAADDWIHPAVDGNQIKYTVDPNTGTQLRYGTIIVSVHGRSTQFSISQDAANAICWLSLSAEQSVKEKDGGKGTFFITAPPSCAWILQSDSVWLNITQTSIQGSGTVEFVAAPNPGAERTAIINVRGQDQVAEYNVYQMPAAAVDLTVSKTDGSSTYVPGAGISYTIVVGNNGAANATGATVGDSVPLSISGVAAACSATGSASCGTDGSTGNNVAFNGVNIAPGAGNFVTITVTGVVSPASTGNLSNFVHVTPGNETDSDPTNNDATDIDTPSPIVDLAVTKTDGSIIFTPGAPISYTIVVRNYGPSSATGVSVNDPVPTTITGVTTFCVATGATSCGTNSSSGNGVTFTNISIPPGASNFVTIGVNGIVRPDAPNNLTNSVHVEPVNQSDTDLTNNDASDTDLIDAVADLSVTKTDGSATYSPGLPIRYTIVVKNTGPSNASGVHVTDAVPTVITGVSVSCVVSGDASCGINGSTGNNISFTGVSITAGSSNYVTLTVNGTVSGTATGDLINSAHVSAGSQMDPNLANNDAIDVDTLTPTTGQVKVCKVAADSRIPNDTQFFFDVSAGTTVPLDSELGAMTASPVRVAVFPGTCALVPGTFAAGTPVTVTEVGMSPDSISGGFTFADIRASRIVGDPGLSSFDLVNKSSVINTGQGTVQVEFTNFVFRPAVLKVCSASLFPGSNRPLSATFALSLVNPLTSWAVNSTPFTLTFPAGGASCAIVNGPFPADSNSPFANFGMFNLGTQLTVTQAPSSTITLTAITSPTGATITRNGLAGTITLNQAPNNINEIRFSNTPAARYDFDSDGASDLSVFRPSTGVWYMNRSRLGFAAYQFGVGSDMPAPADYTGDGKTDVAVFRPASGAWYILRSEDNTFFGLQFGTKDDLPVPADYDGDGKADVAVFRPSDGNWYLQRSTAGFAGVHFGAAEDKPTVGDFDGDGKSDIALFRPSTQNWYRLNSSDGSFVAPAFGAVGDIPLVMDYDGDGKANLAVFRPSTNMWYIARATGMPSQNFDAVQWGVAGDIPVPADYDGDGRTDVATFRPSDGNWYLNQSTSGFVGIHFGIQEDKPTPAAFVY